MAQSKRIIPKKKYEEARKEGDGAAAKLREEIAKKTGKKVPKDMHVDHIKPIAGGGSPTDKRNLKLVPAKQNLKKGAKKK